MPLAATHVTAFYFVGGAAAVWAVVLAFLGLTRPEFPPKGGERVVLAISGLLVVGSIATAILTATGGPKGGGLEAPVKTGFASPSGVSAAGGAASAPSAPSGGASTSAPAPASGKLSLTADPGGALKFNTSSLQAKAGAVTITLSNPAAVPHGIAISGPGVSKVGTVVGQGGTSTVAASLKPGSYTFYCPVPGHAAAGMKGTLTVR